MKESHEGQTKTYQNLMHIFSATAENQLCIESSVFGFCPTGR